MKFKTLTDYFMPISVRDNPSHPRYDELRSVVSTVLVAVPLVCIFPLVMVLIEKPALGYVVNAAMIICILLSVKFWGHYRIPMTTTAIVTYFIVYDWIKGTGMLYSANLSVLHMYLLGAVIADRKYGWCFIFGNILVFIFVYHQTVALGLDRSIGLQAGSAIYTLMMHCLFTLFFGGFLAYLLFDQVRNRAEIQSLQEKKISMLDQAVKRRTEQLDGMRQTIATDFHDQTSNLLATITRQASELQIILKRNLRALPLVDSIIYNSRELYASSKDFLWNLNHDSDDPEELFGYLTSYGQHFYNQFDIAFSVESQTAPIIGMQLKPEASLELILIFKEAMTNVAKHADASEVLLKLAYHENNATYSLTDNGKWKIPSTAFHYGLKNMCHRCQRHGFVLEILKENTGTSIEVKVPLIIEVI